MADIIAFNAANADRALRFGQDIFPRLRSDRGRSARHRVHRGAAPGYSRSTRTLGIDAYMDAHKLDAILFPGAPAAAIAAKAGYPSVQVPAGMVAGVGATATPDYPFGATFTGRAWSEPVLLRLAYAFEQATKARRMPPGVPPLEPDCAPSLQPAAMTPGK